MGRSFNSVPNFMKSWQLRLQRLSDAMAFANIDSLRELEALLESHTPPPATPPRVAPPAYRLSHVIDIRALLHRAAAMPAGQH